MNTKLNSLRLTLALTVAAGFAVTDLHAQTVSATGTLSDVLVSGVYDYTLTIQNTGTVPLEGLWYGWVPGVFDLPGSPTSIASASGWTVGPDGASIQFQGGAGNAIPVGGTGIFTFDNTSTPAAMTTSPSDESTIFAGTIGFTGNSAGVSEIFTPALAAVPEPGTLGLIVTGSLGFLATGWRKLRTR